MDEVKDIGPRKNGGDAYTLLMLLRCEHAARILAGETFKFDIDAMVAKGTIAKWTYERFLNARNTLLAAGYLVRVSEGYNTREGRVHAQYTLPFLQPKQSPGRKFQPGLPQN